MFGRLFRDRTDAGQQLAHALARFRDQRPVVLALPRGGVPVAREVARALGAPLDLVLVRKIGTPFNPELAAGAIADGGHVEVVMNPDVMRYVPPGWFEEETARQLEEMRRRRALYLGGRPRAAIADRTAIVMDDGIATGATMRAALRSVRRAGPRRLVLAVPVAPDRTLKDLAAEVDEVVCLATPEPFGAVGAFYDDFRQIEDAEVVQALAESAPPPEPPRS